MEREEGEENYWHSTTLEWATPTPPPHGNFITVTGGIPPAVPNTAFPALKKILHLRTNRWRPNQQWKFPTQLKPVLIQG